MQTTTGLIWAAVGLGIGFGLAYVIRRRRTASDARRRAATPVVYASRQHARRAARDRDKKQKA